MPEPFSPAERPMGEIPVVHHGLDTQLEELGERSIGSIMGYGLSKDRSAESRGHLGDPEVWRQQPDAFCVRSGEKTGGRFRSGTGRTTVVTRLASRTRLDSSKDLSVPLLSSSSDQIRDVHLQGHSSVLRQERFAMVPHLL